MSKELAVFRMLVNKMDKKPIKNWEYYNGVYSGSHALSGAEGQFSIRNKAGVRVIFSKGWTEINIYDSGYKKLLYSFDSDMFKDGNNSQERDILKNVENKFYVQIEEDRKKSEKEKEREEKKKKSDMLNKLEEILK